MLNGRLTLKSARKKAESFINRMPDYPGGFGGRGILIPGGGVKYFTNAWVALRMLRKLGCTLPIQIWHLGATEIDDRMRAMTLPYDVEFIDAYEIRKAHPIKNLNGWELKPFSILHSRFKEVLLLDADNVPVVNPEFLFKTPQFRKSGAIFWPDFGHLKPSDPIWDICGIPFRDEPEWESGQIVVNKEKCWQALRLALWYNNHSDFFYQYILGDKDTYHLAFRKLNQPVAMPASPVKALKCTLCQHDFKGNRIFQHRVNDKWSLEKENDRIWDFQHEADCRVFLEELQAIWFGRKQRTPRFNNSQDPQSANGVAREIIGNAYHYERIGFDGRPMTFGLDGHVMQGAGIHETYWDLKKDGNADVLLLSSKTDLTCSLIRQEGGIWKGRWLIGEHMPVTLKPVRQSVLLRKNGPHKKLHVRVQASVALDIYSIFAKQVIPMLTSTGVDVSFSSKANHSARGKRKYLPNRILWIQPPTSTLRAPKNALWVSHWNMLSFPMEFITHLNKNVCGIIVPSEWDAACFSCAGINRPLWIMPFGIDKSIFYYSPMEMSGPCVFGLVDDNPYARDYISTVIKCFSEAFPQKMDVVLRIYSPNAERQAPGDSRIQIIQNRLSEEQFASWLQRLTCFLSLGFSFGWSMTEQKALSVGRPLLGTRCGQMADFLSADSGYPVEFSMQRENSAQNWIKPNLSHVISQMQQVYSNRPLASQLGINGVRRTLHLTWKKFFQQLKQILTT